MSELIRREDAIKATWQEPSYTDPINVLTEVRDRINALPAASPWHRVEEPPNDGLYGKLVCDTEGQISVCGGYATVKLQNGSVVYTDSRLLDIFKEETDNWNWEDITHFTHWMPLPEPPKEEV